MGARRSNVRRSIGVIAALAVLSGCGGGSDESEVQLTSTPITDPRSLTSLDDVQRITRAAERGSFRLDRLIDYSGEYLQSITEGEYDRSTSSYRLVHRYVGTPKLADVFATVARQQGLDMSGEELLDRRIHSLRIGDDMYLSQVRGEETPTAWTHVPLARLDELGLPISVRSDVFLPYLDDIQQSGTAPFRFIRTVPGGKGEVTTFDTKLKGSSVLHEFDHAFTGARSALAKLTPAGVDADTRVDVDSAGRIVEAKSVLADTYREAFAGSTDPKVASFTKLITVASVNLRLDRYGATAPFARPDPKVVTEG